MKFQNNELPAAGFQLAPMIDIVFLLLFFFIVTWQITRSELDLRVAIPSSEEGADPQRVLGEIIINVLADGEVIVEGQVMSQKRLQEKLSAVSKLHKNQPVRLRGDENCDWQTMIKVIDTCQKAGIWNISFATQRPREEGE